MEAIEVKFRLTPNTDEFFVLFSTAASNMEKTVKAFSTMVHDFTSLEEKHSIVRTGERVGDDLTRQILQLLDGAFVTPFDREDISALAEELDDIVDDVYHVSELLSLLPISSVIPELVEQVDVLVQMSGKVVELIDRMALMKGLRPLIDEIDQLETAGDRIFRRALVRLFSGELDALEVLKWKGIIESAEHAIDRLEDVADTVGSILVKHA